MKKYFLMLAVLLLSAAIVAPAFAAVEFKYGGMFRARIISQQNFDGVDTEDHKWDDNLNRLDQRFRLYFTFKASENLQLVTKFEGNAVWGDPDTYGRVGADWGGNGPGGESNWVVKNAYLDFAIPNTPSRALVGVQTITLFNSWVVDEDLAGALVKTKLDPVMVTVGYVAGQNDNYSDESENVDSFFLTVDYKGGPLSASLLGWYQDGHNTVASVDPTTITGTPLWGPKDDDGFAKPRKLNDSFSAFTSPWGEEALYVRDNQFFDLGLNVGYKLDWMSAYVTFVKNFGSVDIAEEDGEFHSADYTGWMVDAGFNYFCGPWAFNIGGFYTTGQDWKDIMTSDDADDAFSGNDVDFFTYPMATTKYFSEIMGGGILDNTAPVHRTPKDLPDDEVKSAAADYQWVAYGAPSNLWTVTIGGSYQVLEQTKISASYWYFGSSEDVVSGWKHANNEAGYKYKFDSSIGHEIDLNVTQGIVDGLTLDLVGAYMFAEDAFGGSNNDDDVYELGARLQWAF